MLPYQRKLLNLFLFLIFSTGLSAQTNFYNHIGDSGDDIAYSIINTDDGNLMLTFSTSTSASSDDNIALVKLTEDGNLIWKKVYGGSARDFPRSLIQTSDGGFAILASTYSYGSGHEDFLLIKTDVSGNIQWSKTYGGPQEERAFTLKQTPDGGYIMGGSTQSYGYGFRDAYMVKTDANGNAEWSTSLGGGQAENCFTIQITSEGNYLLTGSEYSFGPGPWGFWIIELDQFGQVNWIKTYGGSGEEHSRIIEKTNDGNYLIFTHTTSFGAGNWDYLVTKVTPDGDLLWSKTYGGPQSDFTGSVVKKANGNFLILGHTESFGEGAADIGVIEINQNGEIVWAKTYGTPANEKLPFGVDFIAAPVSDGGLVIIGHTTGGTIGNTDVMIIKTNASGENDCIGEDFAPVVSTPALSENLISVAPISGVIYNNASVSLPSENIQLEEQCIIPPMAEFQVSDTNICEGDCITLTDLSQNADNATWQFSGGVPGNPTDPTSGEVCFPNAGVFPVTLTVGNSFGTDTYTINIFVASPAPVSITGDDQICDGENLTLTATPGLNSYQWSNGPNTSQITISNQGTYSVTTTDSNGCENEASFEVSVIPVPSIVIGDPLEFCGGGAIFSLPVSVTNTSASEIYSWIASGQGTSFLSDPGILNPEVTIPSDYSGTITYTLTVSQGDCEATEDIFVQITPLPDVTISGPDILCENDSGLLGATSGFSAYQWSTGSTTPVTTISGSGTYSVTVADDDGCQNAAFFNVESVPLPDPDIIGPTSFCQGDTIELSLQENFSSIIWSNGSNAQSITVSEPGNYGVIVTDNNDCSGFSNIVIEELEELEPQISGDLQFCSGQSTTLSGNSGYANYLWSDGTTSQTLTLNIPGEVSLTVTDANGCSGSAIAEVQENPLPIPQISGSLSFCIGGSTTLSSNPDYSTYAWSNGSNDSSIIVQTEGSYSLTVTDQNGCSGFMEVTITEASDLSPQISGPLQFCEGSSTNLDVGSGFESYLWSNGATSQSISVTTPGIYSVTVVHASGCNGSQTVNISENSLPTVTITGPLSFCPDETTVLDAGPGFQSYLWSDGNDTQTTTVSSQGNYSITATDINGCSNFSSIFITELPEPVVEISGELFFCENTQTTLVATSGFESYGWSTGDLGTSISVNTEGNYSLTVTDENGCQDIAQEYVQEITLPLIDAGVAQTLDCNNESVVLQPTTQNPGENFNYYWAGPGITGLNEMQEAPEVSIEGLYLVYIEDIEYSCISETDSVLITDETYQPEVSLLVEGEINCFNESVIIDGSGSQSGTQFSYQWFDNNGNEIPNENSNIYAATAAQSYSMLLLDTLTGCFSISSVTVSENTTSPVAITEPGQQLNCLIETTELSGESSQPIGQLSYFWESSEGNIISGNNSSIVSVNEPGYYYLTVQDQNNGCMDIDSVFVSQDITSPIANAGQDVSITCNESEVQLDGSSSSSGPQYTLNWSNPDNPDFNESSFIISVTTPGIYLLEITNTENGCTSQDEVQVIQGTPPPTDLIYHAISPTCFGDSDGSLVIEEIVGGQGPYLYNLNGQEFQENTTYTGLSAGYYEVVIQDANNCEYTTDLLLENGNDLFLDLGEDQIIQLGDEANLEALHNLEEDEILQFVWTPAPEINCDSCLHQNVAPIQTTTYSATITDTNGCSTHDVVTIFVEKTRAVFVPNIFSPNNDGKNDQLIIFAGGEVESVLTWQIFDRWGELIFKGSNFLPNDPTYGWDGRFRGIPCNSSVFTWVAEVSFKDGEVVFLKGDVTLIR